MDPLSPSRLFRTALLLWVAAFFCLVVPLHHRGLVALPGAETTAGDAAAYCPLCSRWDADNGTPPPADAPIGCAICHLKSNLELPASWTPPPALVADLEFLLPAPAVHARVTLAAPARLRGRGPPVA